MTQSAPNPRVRLLFVGDTSFGENYQADAERQGRADVLATRGYAHMLRGVSDLLDSADFTVANLETPLTLPTPSSLEGRKKYVHWSDPRRATAVLRRSGIGAVSLGNNHACDQGDEGLRSTLDALGAAGIEAFGGGLHSSEAAQPFDKSIAVGDSSLRLAVIGGKQRSSKSSSDIQPYAGSGAGVHGWDRHADAVRVHALRRSDPGRVIVAFPHWGRNYQWSGPRQRRLAHTLIDAGADLVLGHGSHMMGEIECYRGRWIVYSLGNFVFGAPGRYQKIAGAVPFSFAACLDGCRAPAAGASELALSLRLYPMFCDNRETGFRTRVVDAGEMAHVRQALAEQSPDAACIADDWTADTDHLGPYLETPLARLTGLIPARVPTRIVHNGVASAIR